MSLLFRSRLCGGDHSTPKASWPTSFRSRLCGGDPTAVAMMMMCFIFRSRLCGGDLR